MPFIYSYLVYVSQSIIVPLNDGESFDFII